MQLTRHVILAPGRQCPAARPWRLGMAGQLHRRVRPGRPAGRTAGSDAASRRGTSRSPLRRGLAHHCRWPAHVRPGPRPARGRVCQDAPSDAATGPRTRARSPADRRRAADQPLRTRPRPILRRMRGPQPRTFIPDHGPASSASNCRSRPACVSARSGLAITGLLPRFAGVRHRDPRAPQNLQPVGALEKHLRHLLGPADYATGPSGTPSPSSAWRSANELRAAPGRNHAGRRYNPSTGGSDHDPARRGSAVHRRRRLRRGPDRTGRRVKRRLPRVCSGWYWTTPRSYPWTSSS